MLCRVSERAQVYKMRLLMKGFSNLEVFSLVMRLMGLEGIEPAHNGTKGFWDEYLD